MATQTKADPKPKLTSFAQFDGTLEVQVMNDGTCRLVMHPGEIIYVSEANGDTHYDADAQAVEDPWCQLLDQAMKELDGTGNPRILTTFTPPSWPPVGADKHLIEFCETIAAQIGSTPEQVWMSRRPDAPTSTSSSGSGIRSGRASSGRLRNFKAMKDDKLLDLHTDVIQEDNDPEASTAIVDELSRRGFVA